MNLTVITPAKIRTEQEAEWLKVAIASVPGDVEIVLVDDHSPIPWAKVRSVCRFAPTVHVKHLPNGKTGLAAARNLAMAHVKTEFFFPVDADDYLAPDALQIALDNYPGDGFLYGSTILFDDRKRSTYLARKYDIVKLCEAVYWPNGCLQKTANWKAVGGWDETLNLYEDWDYWIRSYKAGIVGHAIRDVLYCYRQNPLGIIQTLRRSPDMAARARGIIESRHLDLYGDDKMCCGHKTIQSKTTPAAPAADKSITKLSSSTGMVLLTFIGTGMTRSFYGKSTGVCYRFSDSKRRFGYVAQEDVPGFLAMREGGKRLFAQEEKK